MADRRDYYNQQAVTEAEFDAGFDGLERADRALAVDIGLFGVKSGLVVTEADPTPNLTVTVESGTAYDAAGQRIRIGSAQVVNLALDYLNVSTAVPTAGQERWVSVFAHFDRQLDDERIDGGSNVVYFVRNESFGLVVKQGAAASTGTASRPALDDDMVLLCDVKLVNGTTAVEDSDINTSRRQNTRVFAASEISAEAHANIGADTVQGQLEEIVSDLAAEVSEESESVAGSELIGARAKVASPYTFPLGTVAEHLELLQGIVSDIYQNHPRLLASYGTISPVEIPTESTVTLGTISGGVRPTDVRIFVRAIVPGPPDVTVWSPFDDVDIWFEKASDATNWTIKASNANALNDFDVMAFVYGIGT